MQPFGAVHKKRPRRAGNKPRQRFVSGGAPLGMSFAREQYFDQLWIACHEPPLIAKCSPVPERHLDPGLLTLLLDQPLRFADSRSFQPYARGPRIEQDLRIACASHHSTPLL